MSHLQSRIPQSLKKERERKRERERREPTGIRPKQHTFDVEYLKTATCFGFKLYESAQAAIFLISAREM
jgi:hypothetical protein